MNPEDKSVLRGCSYILVRVAALAVLIGTLAMFSALFGGPL